MPPSNRRYDIDWVRVIAIALLLIYHVAIGFQPWGVMIGFIANKKAWESLWIPMGMLNIWRIPLLFFVSGMGVYFAMQNRNWKQLLQDRAMRILVPFVFGMFAIFPVSTLIWQNYYGLELNYSYNAGHLWFLGNIFVYVVMLSPVFFYMKGNEEGRLVQFIKRALSTPLGFLPVIAALIAETLIVNPNPYTLYAMTWHGFFLGLLAFFFGFCFVLSGNVFWDMVVKWRGLFVSIAAAFFIFRLIEFRLNAPGYLLVIESVCWIASVFGFASRYLNHSSSALNYLSQSAYPVYILHMIFLFLGSALIFPLDIDVHVQFVIVLLFTVIGCFATYEFVVRRVNIIRVLFGMKKF
ncbi:MAG: acyltransferase family protein [Bacteroidota bacterium]